MEAEEVLKLFDTFWFGHEITTENQLSPSPATNPDHEIHSETAKPEVSCLPTLLDPSLSDQFSSKPGFNSDSASPKPELLTLKLQPNLSGKEVVEVTDNITRHEKIERPVKKTRDMIRRRSNGSKSLPALEFEELKGFMDLGFVFSEEDKDSSLVSIIPGLQRLGKKSGEKATTVAKSGTPRPYLSESWDILDRRSEENPLMNWRFPGLGNEIDMKDHLRSWAHTVASTVR